MTRLFDSEEIAIKSLERQARDIVALSIIRVEPLSAWRTRGRIVRLPFLVKGRCDPITFTSIVNVPKTGEGKWFLKILINGSALLKLNGVSYAGIDEVHTYVPIPVGRHVVDIIVSPRTIVGPCRENIVFRAAYLVMVNWELFRKGLLLLELIQYTQGLPRDDPLRRELEALLLDNLASLEVEPTIEQIVFSHILLYEYGARPSIKIKHVPPPFSDYAWLSEYVRSSGFSLEGLIASNNVQQQRLLVEHTWAKVIEELEKLTRKYGKHGLLYAVAHSHIDAAWLWPKSETVHKVLRTFSTVTLLANDYDFVYVQGSALYYKWIEQYDTKLFSKIKRLIDEGKWLIAGGTWVEPDTMIISGETLVRQFLYGQRYFLSKFGRIARIGWLPDTFGFAGNLPQILAKSGVEVFITHKVSWNDTNEFPFDVFRWRGIDGSEIVAQVLFTNYHESARLNSLREYWEKYRDRQKAPFIVYAYGYGDGGGGPTREMMEYISFSKEVPGVPIVKKLNEEKYIARLRRIKDQLPMHEGEIYLEFHRGVYTTNLEIKEAMAKAELMAEQADFLESLALLQGKPIDYETIREAWETVLFAAFHDIVTGTSVKEVYDEAVLELKNTIKKLTKKLSDIVREIVHTDSKEEKDGILVFNTLPWRRTVTVTMPRTLIHGEGEKADNDYTVECQELVDNLVVSVEIPSLGYTTIPLDSIVECKARKGVLAKKDGDTIVLENEHLLLRVDSRGFISELTLKKRHRKVLVQTSNKLVAYVDKPGVFDAWEIRPEALRYGKELAIVNTPRITINGPLVSCINLTWKYKESEIAQELCLHKKKPVVTVRNRISWKAKSTLVKAWYKHTLEKPRYVFEQPYSIVERTINSARFEVPALHWIDISDGEYGIAIISASRHGYSIRGREIGLSLIRSPLFPNPWSDLGSFDITYYLYPHEGTYVEGEVPKVAAELLYQPIIVKGVVANQESFMEVEPPIIQVSIKPSEDKDGIIVRLFNPYNFRVNATIQFNNNLRIPPKVFETNLIEIGETNSFSVVNNSIRIALYPFEIKTIKIPLYR